MSNKVLIQMNNASFNYQGEEPLFEDLKLTIQEGDVTALVGINGAGKSTLLKLLVGELELKEGSIERHCKPYYVPQVDLTIQHSDITVYEYISRYYENWWELNNETEKLFDLTIDYDAPANTLSGGELMKLNLAIALKNNPDLLILDEPTNHLDVRSIANLIEFIKSSSKDKYSFLIVSHDTYFLDQVVNKVLNLENKQVTTYGGNYSFYVEQKELQLKGAQKQYALAKQKLETSMAQAQKEYEKQQRKIAKSRKDIHEGNERDKNAIANKKESGASTEKSLKTTINRVQNEVEKALENLEEVEERHLAFVHLKNTAAPNNKVIFKLEKSDLKLGDSTLIKDIDWSVNYGERVVIAGDNGVGKTTLIKALLKHGNVNSEDTVLGDAKIDGEVEVNNDLKWVYIDQNYSSVRPDMTLIENLMNYNPSYTEDLAKEQLGKFKFKSTLEMNKLGKNLSGGETVRLIMAMITAFPIDLIVLDEPTNNLDVETVDILINALNKFRGAIIVISHNIDFLNAINVKKAFLIKNKAIKPMNVDPSRKDDYYNALITA